MFVIVYWDWNRELNTGLLVVVRIAHFNKLSPPHCCPKGRIRGGELGYIKGVPELDRQPGAPFKSYVHVSSVLVVHFNLSILMFSAWCMFILKMIDVKGFELVAKYLI